MSSALPTPDNDYAAPIRMQLNKAAWDAAMVSIGERLRAMEAMATDLQAVIDAGTTQALQMISDTVAPNLAAVQSDIDAANAALADFQTEFDTVVAGGVGADNVTESATRVWLTPAQRNDVGALRSEMDVINTDVNSSYNTLKKLSDYVASVQTNLNSVSSSIAASLNLKLNISDKATETDAIGGVDNTTWVTPLRAKQAAQSAVFSIGDIIQTAKVTPDQAGTWIACNGKSYNKTSYPALGTICGTKYSKPQITSVTLPDTTPASILWGNGKFVRATNTSIVKISPDGSTGSWVSPTTAPSITGTQSFFSFANGRHVLAALNAGVLNRSVSLDGGDTWSSLAATTGVFGTIGSGLIYGNGLYVWSSGVSATTNSHLTKSPDLVDFTKVNVSTFLTSDVVGSIAFGNGVFVIASTNGKIARSSDLVTFESVTGIGLTINSLVYVECLKQFVGTTSSGLVYSPDGKTWFIYNNASGPATIGGTVVEAMGRLFVIWTLSGSTKIQSTIDFVRWTTAETLSTGLGGPAGSPDRLMFSTPSSGTSSSIFLPDIDIATEFRVPNFFGENKWIRAL